MRSRISKLLFVVLVALSAVIVTGCNSTATTTASCAFIVGNGQNGNDATLHKIVYPGQTVNVGTSENASYVPCNSRNYIINNGMVKNANNEVVGDRSTLIVATTNTGVSITIGVTAYWTLNESDKALKDFYNVCFKYQCASDKDVSGDNNFATKGWNGMLGEDFGSTLDRSAKPAAAKLGDDIWKAHDPTLYKALGDAMSANFADTVRATLGYPEDLFCGSGNSYWPDPNKLGGNDFVCTPVRIAVDDVQLLPQQADQNSQGALTVAQQRYQIAVAQYGSQWAGYWIGVQDAIDRCKAAQTSCVVVVGDGIPAVTVPASGQTPSPSPTAKP